MRYYSHQETDERPDDYERAVITRPMRAAPVVAIAADDTPTDDTQGAAA